MKDLEERKQDFLEQVFLENGIEELTSEEIESFGFHELTEEEETERKKAIERKGFLPENDEYNETSSSPQEIVEKNPKRFIIEECIPACQNLWAKNIYTFMVSDHLNEGVCWIEVFLDSLSQENKEIYANLTGEDIIKFSYHKGAVNFGVKCVGKEGQEKLLELAEQFQMQDVPASQAYISSQDFLINYCGCYDEVPNPNYVEMTPPWALQLPYKQLIEYMKQYNDWEGSIASQETLKKLNLSKMTQPLDVLIKEHGMIAEGERIYLSPFHYEKHLKYVEAMNHGLDEKAHHSKK